MSAFEQIELFPYKCEIQKAVLKIHVYENQINDFAGKSPCEAVWWQKFPFFYEFRMIRRSAYCFLRAVCLNRLKLSTESRLLRRKKKWTDDYRIPMCQNQGWDQLCDPCTIVIRMSKIRFGAIYQALTEWFDAFEDVSDGERELLEKRHQGQNQLHAARKKYADVYVSIRRVKRSTATAAARKIG